MFTRLLGLFIAAVIVAPLPANATLIAASFSLPQTPYSGNNLVDGVDGFSFAPTEAIRVTELGWYDQGGDGLLHAHQVGIFDSTSQALLATVTVNSASVLGASNFRFAALLTALDLVAGHSYIVAGFGNDVEFAPKKTYVSLRRARQFALVQPSTATRVDIGINLKGVLPLGKLEAAGTWNGMVSHRVRLITMADFNKDVKAWLKLAYEQAG